MHYQMNFRSKLEESALDALIRELQRRGPFAEVGPVRIGPSAWSIELVPRSPGVVVGYASVVEFQSRACRHVEIDNVSRVDPSLQAASSW